jgi:hypothetical protein
LFDPVRHRGSTDAFIDRVLATHAARRPAPEGD